MSPPPPTAFKHLATQKFNQVFTGNASDKDTFTTFMDNFTRYIKVIEYSEKKEVPDVLKGNLLAQALRNPASQTVEGMLGYQEMYERLKLSYLPSAGGAVHEFYQIKMRPGEALTEFVVRFRSQVTKCVVSGNSLDQPSLINQFKLAVNDTYSRIGEEEYKTVDQIIDRAQRVEMNLRRREQLHGGNQVDRARISAVTSEESSLVAALRTLVQDNRGRPPPKSKPGDPNGAETRRCYRCNEQGHISNQCKISDDTVCALCGEKRHIAAACIKVCKWCKSKEHKSGSCPTRRKDNSGSGGSGGTGGSGGPGGSGGSNNNGNNNSTSNWNNSNNFNGSNSGRGNRYGRSGANKYAGGGGRNRNHAPDLPRARVASMRRSLPHSDNLDGNWYDGKPSITGKIASLRMRSKPGEKQPIAEVEIHGKKFLAIVDTGAELSLMRQSVQLWLDSKLSAPDFCAVAIGEKTALPVIGASKIPVDFRSAGKEIGFDVDFLVVPDTIFDNGVAMLLGEDVLYSSSIDNLFKVLTVRLLDDDKKIIDELQLPISTKRAMRDDAAHARQACAVLTRVEGAEVAEQWLKDYCSRTSMWNEFPLVDLRKVHLGRPGKSAGHIAAVKSLPTTTTTPMTLFPFLWECAPEVALEAEAQLAAILAEPLPSKATIVEITDGDESDPDADSDIDVEDERDRKLCKEKETKTPLIGKIVGSVGSGKISAKTPPSEKPLTSQQLVDEERKVREHIVKMATKVMEAREFKEGPAPKILMEPINPQPLPIKVKYKDDDSPFPALPSASQLAASTIRHMASISNSGSTINTSPPSILPLTAPLRESKHSPPLLTPPPLPTSTPSKPLLEFVAPPKPRALSSGSESVLRNASGFDATRPTPTPGDGKLVAPPKPSALLSGSDSVLRNATGFDAPIPPPNSKNVEPVAPPKPRALSSGSGSVLRITAPEFKATHSTPSVAPPKTSSLSSGSRSVLRSTPEFEATRPNPSPPTPLVPSTITQASATKRPLASSSSRSRWIPTVPTLSRTITKADIEKRVNAIQNTHPENKYGDSVPIPSQRSLNPSAPGCEPIAGMTAQPAKATTPPPPVDSKALPLVSRSGQAPKTATNAKQDSDPAKFVWGARCAPTDPLPGIGMIDPDRLVHVAGVGVSF